MKIYYFSTVKSSKTSPFVKAKLRYFAGLREAEAAEALNISVATLKRDWQFAQTWLRAFESPRG